MRIRNFRDSDLETIVSIRNEAVREDRDFSPLSVRTWKEWWSGPDVRLERDLFIVEEEEIWGYGALYVRSENLRLGRINMSGPFIYPSFQRRGAGHALVERLSSEAKDRGAGEIFTSIPEERPSHNFLKKHGFEIVRYFVKMRASLNMPSSPKPEGIKIETFHEGDEEMLVDIHNRGFVDHWNYSPTRREEIEQWKKDSVFDPEGIFFAMHEGKAVGFCAVFVDWEYVRNTGDKSAYVCDLACDPDFRGTGIGSYLLLCAASYAREKSMEALELDVDADNPDALHVYERMGFRKKKMSITYRRGV